MDANDRMTHDLRKRQVVRHRDSIRHGSAARGRSEKVVTSRKHLYKPHGDDSAEYKKEYLSR